MRFGINTFLFASPFTNDGVKFFPQFKQWGFDTVEIAIEEVANIDPAFIRKKLDDNGLVCGSVGAAMGPGRDLRGTAGEQAAAMEYLKAVIAMMPQLGSHTLIGPIYSSVGRAEAVAEEEYKKQWATVVAHLKTLSAYAEQFDVKLAIEPLNRYETDFINTCEQAMRLIDDVNHDALMLMLDTFHMNIEEVDPAIAIRIAGDKIGYFHIGESNRGYLGAGTINFDRIFDALVEIGYDQDVVFESFSSTIVDEALSVACGIWRDTWTDNVPLAKHAKQFIELRYEEAKRRRATTMKH